MPFLSIPDAGDEIHHGGSIMILDDVTCGLPAIRNPYFPISYLSTMSFTTIDRVSPQQVLRSQGFFLFWLLLYLPAMSAPIVLYGKADGWDVIFFSVQFFDLHLGSSSNVSGLIPGVPIWFYARPLLLWGASLGFETPLSVCKLHPVIVIWQGLFPSCMVRCGA